MNDKKMVFPEPLRKIEDIHDTDKIREHGQKFISEDGDTRLTGYCLNGIFLLTEEAIIHPHPGKHHSRIYIEEKPKSETP